MNPLDEALRAAHAAGDAQALVTLYQQAAETVNDEGAAAFFLTHAYVYALETGHTDAEHLRVKLIAMGRETPLAPAPPPRR